MVLAVQQQRGNATGRGGGELADKQAVGHDVGGGVEPPQRNLEGNTLKGVRRWEKPTREYDCVYEQQRNMSKSSSSSDGLLSQHSHNVAGGGMCYENLDMYVQIFVT